MSKEILEAKQQVVAEISEQLKASQSTVVVEYRGLTVAEVTELRRALRAENVGFKVYKRDELDGQGNPYPILHMRLKDFNKNIL